MFRAMFSLASDDVPPQHEWLTPVPPQARKELRTLMLIDGATCAPPAGAPSVVLMHDGINKQVVLKRRPAPPPVVASRVGGSDTVNAATWRVALAPVDGITPAAANGGAGGEEEGEAVVLEAYDRPGNVVSLQTSSDGSPSRLSRHFGLSRQIYAS